MVLSLALAGCGAEPRVPGDSGAGNAASRPPAPTAARAPFVRVLGTAQDGGLPHAACSCVRCEAARTDPDRRRLIAGLAVVLPESGRVFLIDATPDLREQLDRLSDVRNPPPGVVDRAPVDGVYLTHAHIGHYLGLAFFGFEAIHVQALPVFATASMNRFLRDNGPWSQLVSFGNVRLETLDPGQTQELGDGVRITAVQVPHRDEYADTLGFRVEGPGRTLLYVPDTDSWDVWDPALPQVVEDVDFALLDATFYSLDELPGRPLEDVPHPLIVQSMDLLAQSVAVGKLEVYFTHLNHSNPAVDPNSPERAEIVRRGFAVLEEGQEFRLD